MTAIVGTDVNAAAERLRAGGLVAFGTETVYGLGANALDPAAVARVFEAKERPSFDPLIVHVASWETVSTVVADVPPTAATLTDRFWPGPLTLVLPKREVVPDLVTAGLPSVAVRMPGHAAARSLIEAAGVPVAAPSANRFGRLSPTTAEAVVEQLGDRIDYVLDVGPCAVGVESTVLRVDGDEVLLLRPGGTAVEEIEAVVGPVRMLEESEHPVARAQPAPGMLPRHYAPRTPIVMAADDAEPPAGRCGLLTFLPPADASGWAAVEVLSPSGDLREAATRFFASIRSLDGLGLDTIVARPFPEEGLGRALNDRLKRAAT